MEKSRSLAWEVRGPSGPRPRVLVVVLVGLLWLAPSAARALGAQESSAAPESADAWRRDPQNAHGLALAEVVAGRAGDAVARLRGLVESRPDDPAFEPVARDLARIAAWYDLTERFWKEAIDEQLKLTLTVRSKKLSRVEIRARDEDGALLFGTNKFGLRRAATDELDLLEVAAQMGKASEAIRNDPSRRWLQLLAGESKAERWLEKAEDEEARALAPDAARYPDLLERGAVLLAIEAALGDVAAYDPARVEATLTRVEEAREGGHALFEELRPRLREGVGRLLERRAVLAGPEVLLNGALETLGDGRARLSYDFANEEQAADFVDSPEYLANVRERVNQLAGPSRSPTFRWREGEFEAVGAGCVRLDVPFEGHVLARWTIEFRPRKNQVDPNALQFFVGVHDDGQGSYAAVMDFGNLEICHGPSYTNKPDYSPTKRTNLVPKKRYAFELERDDAGRTTCRIDGEVVNEFEALPHVRRGGAFLWVHSDLPVVVHDFALEGGFPEESYAVLRASYVQRELAARGW